MSRSVEVLHIVVVYNGLNWLPDVVDSVRASGTGEVWAIDHGSSDGSWEWLRDHLPEANRVQGPNAGFGEGNNRGLEEALRRNVDAVHLLNQDAKVDPAGMATQVEWLLDRADRGHRLEVSSPIHWDWTGAEPYWHFDHLYAKGWREKEAPFEVRFINAAAWLMTLDTVRTVGGFNPAFFMYGEDNEWAHRLRRAGGSFWIHPDASLYHDEKVKPWPKATILERMAYADEVTRFFEGEDTAEVWRKAATGRAIGRALHRSRWADSLMGTMWKGERAAARRVAEDLPRWTELRAAMRTHDIPHLTP